MIVRVWTGEQYPVHMPIFNSEPDSLVDEHRLVEVEPEVAARWERTVIDYQRMQHEIDVQVNPRCPECGHPQIRHQEWSASWDYWGCLERIQIDGPDGSWSSRTCCCQYGKPEGR